MAILRRTERAMIRVMCDIMLINRRNTEELMAMLGLEESLDRMVKANNMRWYGHVLRRGENNVLLKALQSAFRIAGSHRKGTTKTNVEKISTKGNA